MKEDYEHTIKIMLVGDSGVGKTAFMNRFCQDIYTEKTLSTVGLDYKGKVLKVNNKKCLVQLWDTAGQEKFRTITPNFYRGAMAIVLFYSVEDRDTFSSIGIWLKQIKKYAPQNLPMLLVANKCDLTRRQVLEKEGKTVAQQYQIEFMECSAKQDLNINEAVSLVSKSVKVKMDNEVKSLSLQNKKSVLEGICSC